MRRRGAERMVADIKWDDEVDVLCVGAEAGVLAAGIVAANAGFDAYLGISEPVAGGGALAASLGYRGADKQTTEHLSGFNYAFETAGRANVRWPVRAVEEIAPLRSRHRGTLEPFFGAPLEQWARRCAAAPNGVLYNRVGKRQMTEMRCSARGEKVEAAVVGSLPLSPDRPPLSLLTWLKDCATAAGLRPHIGVRLAKLIFAETGLVGAVLDTAQGIQTVRARENLIIGVGDPLTESMQPRVSGSGPVTVQVGLVSKTASRFGELEILTTAGTDNRLVFTSAPKAELQQAG